MKYTEIRRKDRVWADAVAAEKLLLGGEYGFLALADADSGYGVPLSYAFDADKIYFHCAPEGRKLEAIKICKNAAFVVVGKTRIIPGEFTTSYQSVMAQGEISQVSDEEEKRKALRLLVKKYAPDFEQKGEEFIEKSFARTAVLRLDIKHISAKSKQDSPQGGKSLPTLA